MEKTLIIQSHLEHSLIGLGDALLYSIIPQLAKENYGYEKVYISNLVKYRNEEIREVVWELNPFIDGFVDQPGTFLNTIFQNLHPNEWRIEKGKENLIDTIIRSFSMENNIRFNSPKIYYQPNTIPYLQLDFVYDPFYVTYTGEINQKQIQEEFNRRNIKPYQVIFSKPVSLNQKQMQLIPYDKHIVITSLKHYLDVIYSCGGYFCLFSGSSLLAPAINKQANVFLGNYIYGSEEYWFIKKNNYLRF